MTRPYDLVVFGATGFTGRLTARYLAHRAPAGLRWAIAGRSRTKLDRIKGELCDIDPRSEAVGVELCDNTDPGELRALAASTRVVATTVGPYARHGEPLARACAASGTDCLDITGEPEYVARILERYDAQARETDALLVSCCGFDSIPADLGALYTARQLEGDGRLVEAFVKAKGGASGGTWTSLVEAFATGGAKLGGGSGGGGRRLHYRDEVKGWALPMPVIDPWIVGRSAKARPDDYGADFGYAHYLRLGSLAQVAAIVGGVAGVYALAQLGPTRAWLESLRKPGQGPSEEQRIQSFFQVVFLGHDRHGHQVTTRVSGGDAGYDETSKMLAECALLAATERDQVDARGGVVTPATAFGTRLIDRLQEVGIAFETL